MLGLFTYFLLDVLSTFITMTSDYPIKMISCLSSQCAFKNAFFFFDFYNDQNAKMGFSQMNIPYAVRNLSAISLPLACFAHFADAHSHIKCTVCLFDDVTEK